MRRNPYDEDPVRIDEAVENDQALRHAIRARCKHLVVEECAAMMANVRVCKACGMVLGRERG